MNLAGKSPSLIEYMFKKIYYLLRVFPKLGYKNVAYMLWYRFSMKTGIRKLYFQTNEIPKGIFFEQCEVDNSYPENWKPALKKRIDQLVEGKLNWFFHHTHAVGDPPNWHLNPFSGDQITNPIKHWTKFNDFDLEIGDIKTVWEPSRFDWLTDLARGYRVFGDKKYLDTINNWLNDWLQNNPVNLSLNWRCGQEASIRVFKLFTASVILKQSNNIASTLDDLIWYHLKRIKGNIRYSIVQDNNHGTSEAAGLYIGSLWLLNQKELSKKKKDKLENWRELGRNLLKERINTLVGKDGTFAQKSVTYHRLVIDTLSIVIQAQKLFDDPPFDTKTLQRLEKLGKWQVNMTISENGDAPNIGSNDGAMLESLHECGYRDFRPSSQQFFGLLKCQKVYPKGIWDEPLYWRSQIDLDEIPKTTFQLPDLQLLDKQFLIIRNGEIKCFLKIPDSEFRPGLDVFHLDIWYKGENIFLDSGSYSYNKGKETEYFKSIKAHNTVQFGSYEPMPKISHFLNGEWITPSYISEPYKENDFGNWEGAYVDYLGNKHKRTLQVSKSMVRVIDEVETNEQAVVRFHLNEKVQKKTDNSFSFTKGTITFFNTQDIAISESNHSLFYMNKKRHTLLDAKFKGKKVITEIAF